MRGLQVLRKVAEGSAVQAYLATSDVGQVLVQVSRPELASDPELYGRFLDVSKRSTGLSHPALLSMRQAHCAADGRFVLTSDPVSGRTAEDWLRERGPLSSDEGVQWGVVLCEALQFLHEHGVVHGNLSPANVFLELNGPTPEVRLLDTGLLLFRASRSLNTPSSLVLVSPEYLSPERAAGQRATPASDVYGLGVLLFELLTGLPPYRGPTPLETRRLHLKSPLPQMPDHLRGWKGVLGRCLAREPSERFSSVMEVRDALLQIQEVLPVVVLEPEELEEQARAAKEDTSEEPTDASGQFPAELRPAELGRTSAGVVPVGLRGDLGPGSALGSYLLEQAIGEGGMGKVFLATHRSLGRRVAIKVLRPELAARPAEVRRFVQEAQAVNRVNHPNIVQVHDLIEEPGRIYFVMELLEGRSVKDIGRDHPTELGRAVRWTRQAAEALEAAHKVGVIHRDIKPDNLFVTADAHGAELVKVLDFGVARIRQCGPLSRVTQVGQVVGTPLWMAPEQVMGREAEAAVDVYALATVLHVLLMRRFPFPGKVMSEIVMARLATEAEPLGTHTFLGERIPSALREFGARCLSRNIGRRPTMTAMVSTLRTVEAGLDFNAQYPDAGRPWWKLW